MDTLNQFNTDSVDKCDICADLMKIRENIRTKENPNYGKVWGYPAERKYYEFMFVAQNPSVYRDSKNIDTKLFNGDSCGNLFTDALTRCKLKREDVYVTNLVKCSTIDNQQPTEVHVKNCKRLLIKEIEIINPRVIITVGTFAKTIMSVLRNQEYQLARMKYEHIHHPAYVLRGGMTREAYRDDVYRTLSKYLKTTQTRLV